MSFAVCYACYKLLEDSNYQKDNNSSIKQIYVHKKTKKIKKKSSCKKKFNNYRGGSVL